jgi:hypothetical protein
MSFHHTSRYQVAVAMISSVVALLLCSGNARSEFVSFEFTGRVTSIVDHLGVLGEDTSGLTTFYGSYTFDAAAAPIHVSLDLREAIYQFVDSPAEMIVRLGGFTFRTAPDRRDVRIIVRDESGFSGSDDYQFMSMYNDHEGLMGDRFIPILDMHWMGSTIEHEPFSSLNLPRMPPSLAMFGGGAFEIRGECTHCDIPDPTFTVRGELTSLASAANTPSGDINGDGWTDTADLAMFVQELGSSAAEGRAADLDRDGRVGVTDLMLLRARLNEARAELGALIDAPNASLVAPSKAVPEPSAWAMLAGAASMGILAMGLAARRRITCA